MPKTAAERGMSGFEVCGIIEITVAGLTGTGDTRHAARVRLAPVEDVARSQARKKWDEVQKNFGRFTI